MDCCVCACVHAWISTPVTFLCFNAHFLLLAGTPHQCLPATKALAITSSSSTPATRRRKAISVRNRPSHYLYRSALPIHNHLRHEFRHLYEKVQLFTCKNPVLDTGREGLPTQRVTHSLLVQRHELRCDFKSFNPVVFERHLSAAHPKTKTYS